MKRFLQSVFAILQKTEQTESTGRPERPNPTPLLEVRSQLKAGEIVVTKDNGGCR
jgi:hypothetical protein